MNLTNFYDKFNGNSDEYLGITFAKIFGKMPQAYKIYFNTPTNITYKPTYEGIDFRNIKAKINVGKLIENAVRSTEDRYDYNKSKRYIISTFSYSDTQWITVGDYNDTQFLIDHDASGMTNELISTNYQIIYTTDIENTFEIIKKWFEPVVKNDKLDFGIAAVDSDGSIYTSWYDYSNHEVNIEKNYNDDLPYDKMCKLIETNDKSELMLFYGAPGTGKTSLIKHFISKYPDKDFIFIDGTILCNVSQDRLMSYFLECQNTIFVLEDCEKVLMDREHNINPVMPILLNITDGIIGDVLGVKLICTFNTALSNIDKALIRKGRLSLKYEFKKLSKDKVQKILNDNDAKEMTLADIYYNNEENDFSKKPQNKIGF